MADNLSEVLSVLNDINTTIDINSSDILQNAISYGNAQTNNWLGIFIFLLLGISLIVLLLKSKNDFKLNSDLSLSLFFLNVFLDIGFLMYQYRILENIQLIIFLLTAFISLCTFGIIKKDLEAVN